MDPYRPTEFDLYVLAGLLDRIDDLDAPEVQRELAAWSGLIQFWPEHRPFADAALRLFERFPERYGANGMRFLGNVFDYMFHGDPAVVESVVRRPSAQATAILTWWAAWGDLVVDGYDLRQVLCDVADDPRAPRNARRIAQEYLREAPDRHPGLTNPRLPLPSWDEIIAWERATPLERLGMHPRT